MSYDGTAAMFSREIVELKRYLKRNNMVWDGEKRIWRKLRCEGWSSGFVHYPEGEVELEQYYSELVIETMKRLQE